LLAECGAIVLDADSIVRDLQRPGTDVYRAIIDRFGPSIVGRDGTLDRAGLAQLVFRDEDALHALNAIVHPSVMKIIAERIEELKETDAIVVLDVPLLVEVGGGEGVDTVVVVEAPEQERISRLVRDRDMTPEDALARMATQASNEQRLALADEVIRNDGSPEQLKAEVDALWERLQTRSKPS
jgi:dephospho-CoA kinase